MPLARGARVGPYEIVAPLGAGGMGEVYRAIDAKLDRSVAIKVLNLDAGLNTDVVRRFEQEARAASSLNHPGIVTIHDTGHSDGRFYIVMEFVDGITLRHMLHRGAPALKKALQLASQLADALAKAHEVGVVHRDLKPENVMVTGEGHVKIVDFGLAKLAEPTAQLGSGAGSVTQSAQGVMLGTIGYMSPEQVRGETADFRADHFAFGAILYELATGERAFQRATAVETLSMILREEPARPVTIKPALPAPVVWTIERCLSKDPADRYASTRDLAREMHTLRDHLADLDSVSGLPAAGHRWRPSVPSVVAIATAMALGAIGAYFTLRSNRPGQAAVAPAPTFKQLTFRRGLVTDAEFAPDGQTILYSAAWDGAPLELYETRASGPESRVLGQTSASDGTGISVGLTWRFFGGGPPSTLPSLTRRRP